MCPPPGAEDVDLRPGAVRLGPEYTELLVRTGIDAISVNIDFVDRTRRLIDVAERRVLLETSRDMGEQ